MPLVPPHPWLDSDAYRYLEGASPCELAWEWLRRDPDYRQLSPTGSRLGADGIRIAGAATPASQARWGCLNMPAPDRPWADYPVLWSPSVDPTVLQVMTVPARAEDCRAFDLRRWRAIATLVLSPDREHLLLQDAGHAIRLDVTAGSLLDGPVLLFHDFSGTEALEPRMGALRHFLLLCRTGHFPSRAALTSQRSRRMVLALRAHDCLAQGASIRDIGVMIHGYERVRADWPGSGDALKSQARRLIALSQSMASGGYKDLLRHG